jgi:hypothetical protein
MGYDILREPKLPGARLDLEIKKNGLTVYAELKYYSKPVPPSVLREVIGIATIISEPVLLITNSKLPIPRQTLAPGTMVDFVQWRDERDNLELRSTLERLLRRLVFN